MLYNYDAGILDVVLTLGVLQAAAAKYEWRYPNRRTLDLKTIIRAFQKLRETGSLLSIHTSYERSV